MKSYNTIEMNGILGKDARVQEFNGKTVANFAVATEYNYKKQDGTWDKETTWLDVCAWNGFGVCDLSLLKKGTKVHVVGRMRQRQYTDNQGKTQTIKEVIAEVVDILYEPEKKQAQAIAPQTATQSAPMKEDDLPF